MVYSLSIAFFIYFRIPETLNAADRSAFNLSVICSNYAKGLTHGAFMTGVVAHGILFMGGILYSAGSADFVIKVMGLDVDEFGWLSIPLIFASFAGAWGSIRLAKRLRPKRMIVIVSLLTLAGSMLAAVFDYLTQPGFFTSSDRSGSLFAGHGASASGHDGDESRLLSEEPWHGRRHSTVFHHRIILFFCRRLGADRDGIGLEICTCIRFLRSAGSIAMAYFHATAPGSTQTSGHSGNHAVSYLNLRLLPVFSSRLPCVCTTLALMQKTADIITVFFETQADTEAFARRVAQALLAHESDIAQHGFNLRLNGGLGAGKTTFTRALLRACGVTGRVRSPTFELVEDYEIGKTLAFHHFDFYRFESAEEFDEAGFRELFGPGMVTACEWSEKAAPYLPDADLEISLSVKDLSRDASLKAYTPLGRVVLMEVCA